MTEPVIPQQVLQFIAQQIDTVPQLECLLLLHQHDNRAWLQEEIAARIYISRETAQGILEALVRRKLVSTEGDPPRYRFTSSEAGSHALVAEVSSSYQRSEEHTSELQSPI